SPTLPDPTDESTSRISASSVKSANESGSTSRLGEATPPESKSEENARGSEDFPKARSTDADSSEPTLSAKGEVSLAHSGAIEPGSPAPRRLIPTISATPSLPS